MLFNSRLSLLDIYADPSNRAGMRGKSSAASIAAKLTMSFPMIKFGLSVGIGGGAPSKNHDIRLGDVVVSKPEGVHGGVFQLDFGKDLPTGFEPLSTLINKPPKVLLSALQTVFVDYEIEGHKIAEYMKAFDQPGLATYLDPGAQNDILFEADYEHVEDSDDTCDKCARDEEVKRVHTLSSACFRSKGSENTFGYDRIRRYRYKIRKSAGCLGSKV